MSGAKKLLNLAGAVQKTIPGFTLAGGTAIMLKYGHRESIDLDFFKTSPFSFNKLSVKCREKFEVENEVKGTDNLDLFIEGVKVSFVYFPFTPVEQAQSINGITMYSDYDLFLNKVYVAGRRIDPKDPFDAAYLASKHSWEAVQVKKDFEKKFPDQSFEIFLGALLSFEDYEPLQTWVKEELLAIREDLGQ